MLAGEATVVTGPGKVVEGGFAPGAEVGTATGPGGGEQPGARGDRGTMDAPPWGPPATKVPMTVVPLLL